MSPGNALPGARELTLKERIAVMAMSVMNRVQRGHFYTDYMTEMVRVHGLDEMEKFGNVVDDALKTYEAQYGPFMLQLLTGLSAMWTGCTYCSVGHVLTANLHYFKEHGALTGLDEGLVYWLQAKPDAEVLDLLESYFPGEGHALTRELYRRLFDIRAMNVEEGDEGPHDAFLHSAAAMWNWVNECSIRLDPVTVPPMDAIGKDRKLLRRYEQERAAWRKAQPNYPSEQERLPWKRRG